MRTAKRAFAVVCLLAFSLVAFAVPAAADYDFTDQPIPHATFPYPDGFWLGKDGTYIQRYVSVTSSDDSTVALFGYMNGNWCDIVAVSNVQGTNMGESTDNQTVRGWSCTTYDDVSGYYYGIYHYFNPAFIQANFPIFSDLRTGLTAASLFLQYQAPQVDTQTYRFTVPAGYVAYISLVDPDQDIDISATMFQNSALIGSNGSYWPSNATIRDGASYPTSGTSFPISGAQTIRWFKDAGGATNLLGQTKAARSTFSATTNLVEIYNPYHTGSTVGDSTEAATSWLAGDPNPNLVVTVTGLSPDGVRMYALSDRLDVSSDASSFIVSGSNDDFGSYVESSNQPPEDPDPTNPQPVISWKTQDGDPTPAPTPGGENEPIQSASIADILSNFLSRFTSLFTEGFDAIRNLSENASQFVSRLSSLYAWLPPQILGVLTSAIILAIIIGVLKVFL